MCFVKILEHELIWNWGSKREHSDLLDLQKVKTVKRALTHEQASEWALDCSIYQYKPFYTEMNGWTSVVWS